MRRWIRSFLRWIYNLFSRKKMRRKISLYIGDRLADLDDQSFILFNYTMDDLSNPTIVKNSYSQQITLKGTPANNAIFGGAFQADRRIGNTGGQTGADFNASQKTPFTIFNEMSEVIESGYVKLDSVSRNGADIEYKITLYGGLGSFFYALSYDENGNKRTLADLDYLGTGSPETELDFTINATSVQAAWNRLRNGGGDAKWSVINFAPAYNGIPEGNFSPNKGIVDPLEVGLQDQIRDPDSGTVYSTRSGYVLVNMAESQDEWAVKDLRSYLQRPVLSMDAFWYAICNPANNGGYEVDADILTDSGDFSYQGLWLTLPTIPSLGTMKQASGDLSLNPYVTATTGNEIGRYEVSGSVPLGTRVSAVINCKLRFNSSAADAHQTLYRRVSQNSGRNTLSKFSVLFLQAVAYASDDTIVGGSAVKYAGGRMTGKETASACGFVPVFSPSDGVEYEAVDMPTFERVSTGVFQAPGEISFSVEASNVAYYKILAFVYQGTSVLYGGGASTDRSSYKETYTGTGQTSIPELYLSYSQSYTPTGAYVMPGAASTISYTSPETLRTGATITKAMLLSSSHTPAEYMLSFCKIFGLYFTMEPGTKKITIQKRNDLYEDETIDLTKRVDRSKGISIRPLVFDAKWYDFILEGAGGAFYDEYLDTEGIPYGLQRVNTGYDFNAESVNLMDSVVFKNACTILARSKYFNIIDYGGDFVPSPFIDKGNTYTLWSTDGDTLDTDISCPPSGASVTYYNENPRYKGYDILGARKLELRTADGKPIDGSDILVFLEGWNRYDYFKLTDDLPVMDVLNDGVPCWLLGAGGSGQNGLYVPIFQRYKGDGIIEDSLDFGVPRQFDIPGIRQQSGSTIYERGWKKYMADRYDANTKVMTCHVDFSGMQVGQDLLRKFYWYDNSLWVLNAIRNYSLTTFDPVECEFVQVQDKDNYLNGQTY